MPMPWEMDWSATPEAPAAVKVAPDAKPWEMDWGGEAAAPKEVAPRSAMDKLLGRGGERYQLWPERLARDVGGAVVDAATLPRDVYQGKVAPMSPEGRERALSAATVLSPAGEFAGTGAQIARRAGVGKVQPGEVTPELRPVSPNIEAAQTAADLDAPLPAGIVSDKTGVQALTQAARQLPLVGQQIDDRVAGTVKAAGGRVNDIATELTGGHVPDRAVTGANARSSLEGVIESNNGKIDATYDDLRSNFIKSNIFAELPKTRAARDAIGRQRWSAGLANQDAGLADIDELLTSGRSFDGLVRARNQVGKIIGLAKNNPNPGFDVGDFRRLYAAMSADMENIGRTSANLRPGVNPNDAVAAFRRANAAADEIIGHNANIQRLLNIKSDERLVGSVINSAKDKTGNARVLWQLRNQMPKQDFEEIVGVGLSELGHDAGTDQFSLAKFAKGWNEMGDFAKSTLIADPTHRKALDDIAKLGGFLKDADKYVNKSGTGRANAVAGILGAGAGVLASLEPAKMMAALAALGSGYGMTKILARPATANTLRKWATIANTKQGIGTPTKTAALTLATRNLLSNLRDIPGLSGGESAVPGATPAGRVPLPRPAPMRKIQDRLPAAP